MPRSLLFSLLLSPLLLTCSSPNENRITIWAHFDPPEKILVEKQLNYFASDNPGWKFKLVTYSKQEIKNLYPISVIGNSGPTILYGFSSDIGQLAELKVLEPLESLLDSIFLTQYSSFPVNPLIKLISQETGQSHLYQLADQVVNQQFLLYNKNLISLSPDAGQFKLPDSGPKPVDYPYDLVWDYTSPYFYYHFVSGSGGQIVNEYDQPQLDSPEAIQGLQVFREFSQTGIRLPLESNLEQSRIWFRQKKSAMLIDGLYQADEFKKQGIQVGITSVSSFIRTKEPSRSLIFMKGYSINPAQSDEKKKMAAKLIMFLCNKKNQLERTLVSFNLPTSNEVLADTIIQKNEDLKLMISQVTNKSDMSVSPEASIVLQELTSGYYHILKDKMISPEQSSRTMQTSSLTLIKNIRK